MDKLNNNSMRKQLVKKQLKRKSSLFGSDFKEPPKKRLFDVYDDSLDSSLGDSFSHGSSFYSFSKQSASPLKKKYLTTLPVDLRLATKIRVISDRPFPFSDTSNNNAASDVKFNSSTVDDGSKLLAQTDLAEMQMPNFKNVCSLTILKSAGLYYQYPNISFMQMYPRLDGVARSNGIRTSLLSFGNEVVDAVQSEWLKSFEHLFDSWKNGKRNSFYICGPQFTILFIKVYKPVDNIFDSEDTCMGLSDFWEHRVIITPTSSGFRKLLKAHEISFILPLKCVDEIHQENWLRDIGFSPSKLKVPTSDSQDQFLAEDSATSPSTSSLAAETTIAIVQLTAIDAFCKLMIEKNLGWAKTGQQAGLPPTILATDSFLNSTLKSLTFKTQSLKKPDGMQYTLDVEDGPILPHVPLLLHEFFRSCNNQFDENTLKIFVNGRSICDGFNEASSESYKNLSEFTFDGCKSRYFY